MMHTMTQHQPATALRTFTCQMGHVCPSANANWRAAYKSGLSIRRVDAAQHEEVS